ncbi:DNA-binding transcriptional regulator CsiR [Enterobacteriaceae bacterium RIT691]|nr:DNA-binding transcriptional regulator CsiR [Enterobacteriaceae bacterium RIT691]
MTPLSSPESGAESVYHRLKTDILRGHYPPGEKLLMSELKSRYALGVGPLREVLSRLVAEHLVGVVNQKGYRVATMSVEEMSDVYEARARLEAVIVEMAVERGDDEWEARIVATAHTLTKVAEVHTPQEMIELWDARHKAFHDAIASGCGSKSLLQARAFLMDQAERYRQLWLKRTVLSEDALHIKREEHAVLMDALLKREAKAASQLVLHHLLTPVPLIQEIIAAENR